MKARLFVKFTTQTCIALIFMFVLFTFTDKPFNSINAMKSEISALSQTITIYGDSADGEVLNRWCTNDWNTCRNASTGNARWQGLNVGTVGATRESGGDYTIQRTFLFFDTSSISADVQITGVTLYLYAGQYLNGTKTVHVSPSTASIPLTIADFNNVEFISGGSVTPTASNTWVSINFNSSALNWITKGGMTRVALIHDFDLNNDIPDVTNDIIVGLSEDTLHRPYLLISYSTISPIVSEARLDIGMPYITDRGCPSSYTGCGGRFHGFFSGVCTDLVLDSYNAGLSFNIQDALYQDSLTNRGLYRHGTARNSEDMRQYFINNQSYLSHDQPYQIGDIAFFDWGGNGLTDHVLIISDVDSSGRPLKMVDASGVINENRINTSGLAFEHNWSNHYELYIQGHARLNSSSPSSNSSSAEPLQELRVTVDSTSIGLSLFDSNGKSVSELYDENLVASNVEDSIPYIPRGRYTSVDAEKTIIVYQPLSNTDQYFINVEGLEESTYSIVIETLQDDSVTASQTISELIGIGEVQTIGINVTAPDGVINFTAQSPTSAPVVNLPSSISLFGLVGTSAQLTFNISEIGGEQTVSDAYLTTTNLSSYYGIHIPSDQLSITPSTFSLEAGGDQQVIIEVNLTDLEPGEYLGSLLLTSQSGSPVMVPLTLNIKYFTRYLPLITK